MSTDLPGMGGDFAKGASGPPNPYDTSPTGLGISPAYLAPGASVSATSSASVTLPSGSMVAYAGSVAPAGYVLCDGSTYDGTNSSYLNLWNAIGTTYGGSGQSAFQVPDLRGRVVVGKGTNASVNALGTSDGQAVANRRPHHRTTNGLGITDPGHSHTEQGPNGAGGSLGMQISATAHATSQQTIVNTTASATTGISINGSVGTGNANDNLDAPSFIVVNHLIAL